MERGPRHAAGMGDALQPVLSAASLTGILTQTRASARRGGVGTGGEICADDACSVGDVGLDGGASAFHLVLGELIQKLAMMVLRRLEAVFVDRQIKQRPGLEPE